MKGLTLPTALLLVCSFAGATGTKPTPLKPMLPAPSAIGAQSAIAIDAASGKVLWSKNPDKARFPASTTKIMTGLLLAENTKPDDTITAPWDVALVRESSMHLRPFEKLTARDMLAALMLRSANDGCYAVAVQLAGSVAKFSDMMNARAKEIGCTGTHFHNPNGLNDPQHFTTARDLALIGREAMKNPLFAEAVGTYKTKIERSVNKKDLWMVNHNKRLPKDPTCDGIKTGWTIPAGRCFVGSTTRDGWRAITVVLKATDWQKDTVDLTDWVYAKYGRRDRFEAGKTAAEAPVVGGTEASVAVAPERSAYNLVLRGSAPDVSRHEFVFDPSLSAPVVRGQKMGEVVLTDGDGFEQRVPLLAQSDVPATPTMLAQVAPKGGTGSGLLIGGAMFGGLVLLKGRSKRRVMRRVVGKGF